MIQACHKEHWDSFCDFYEKHGADNLWQSPQWFRFMKATNRNPEIFVLRRGEKICASFQVTTRYLPTGFSYSYLGRGPVILHELLGTEKECRLFREIISFLKARPVQYTLIDPCAAPGRIPELIRIKSKDRGIIPNHTRVIDLTRTEKDILLQMTSKGRYNVRLAEKRGVRVREGTELDRFYELMRESSQRHKIPLQSKGTFEKMLQLLNAKLFFAEKQGILHATALLVIYKNKAVYYYGASSRQYARDMGSYLLQWSMIKYAKQAGCKIYDFHGVSPQNEVEHYLRNVSIFKKRFGGRIEDYEKHRILVSGPIRYFIFSLIKKALLPFF
ncbi:MAG: peptidoglycan bridge formation glycyltransferase FemA/FemB family protein [Spirochaetia bacterium]